MAQEITIPTDPTIPPLEARILELERQIATLLAAVQAPPASSGAFDGALHYDSRIRPDGRAVRPYSAALTFVDDNPAVPLGGIFQILAHGPDDQIPPTYHDHICIYVPNARAKNGRDHVVTVEAATAANDWRPRISLGGGAFGAQVDYLDSTIYRKVAGQYYRSVLTVTPSGLVESWVKGGPKLPA